MQNFYLKNDIEEIVKRIGPNANQFSGKTILLTGGMGFLGQYFIEVFNLLNQKVLDSPAQILVIDNYITSKENKSKVPKTKYFKFFKHDVIKPFNHDGKLDFIVHAAGIASPYHYRRYPLETLDVAINGTRNMLELAEKSSAKFIFFSSSEIYGDPDDENIPTNETYRGNVSCQGPRACYDESKRVGETLCYIFNTRSGTKTNVIRPFNVFGPGMEENDYRVLSNFASRIKSNKPLDIYGNGTQTRSFCYITDALVGFLSVIINGKNGEVYNIGNPKPELSMLELAEILKSKFLPNLQHRIIQYPDSYPDDEPMRRSPNIQKAKQQLNFFPMVEFEDGISRFLSWTNKNYVGKR